MKILAFETATEACSVAVYDDGNIIERFELAPRLHTQLVLPWADELLAQLNIKKNQLDAIAVGIGPGAFTGVRLAVAVAQGIAIALDKPVIAVSTLAALAMQAHAAKGSRVMAAIDARMGEIYCAEFLVNANGLVDAAGDEIVIAPEAYVYENSDAIYGVGTGFSANNHVLKTNLQKHLSACVADAFPHAADIATLAIREFELGKILKPDDLEPAYLRNKVALTLKEQGK
jgi:tRNA threonylcarbamoyladenosine biosynthesis protein TsaB